MADPKGSQPAQSKDAGPAKPKEPGQRAFVSEANVEEVTGAKPLNGYMTTLMHLAKCYVGTGIFAMGEGFKNSGLLFGPILLIIIGIINLNCQHILVRTAIKIAREEEKEVKPTFAETVQYTLESSKIACLKRNSKGLGYVTNIFLCVCELGFCCVYFVFIARHILEICDSHDWLDRENALHMHLVLAIILLPMWASTFLGNLKLLFPLSVIANVLLWAGICIVYYYTTYQGLPHPNERNLVAPVERWPLYFGTALYAFEGITFIIPLRNEMKKPEQFIAHFGVLNLGMIFVIFLYLTVGLFGYWKYGEEVESSVFLNLKKEDPNVSDVINSLISIGVLFTFTLHMYIPFEITFPLFYRKYGPFKYGFLIVCIYRSVPVLFTWVMANIIPFLGLFITLVGATAGAFLALIMPAILEMVAFQDELTVLMIIKDSVFITLGVIGSVSGTILSIIEIIQKFRVEYFGYEP